MCAPILSTENLDLVLTPGLAFTRNGKRLGTGKGYYDRFLARCFRKFKKYPFTLGLAFKEQIVSDIPATNTDIIIDQVLYTDNWTTIKLPCTNEIPHYTLIYNQTANHPELGEVNV